MAMLIDELESVFDHWSSDSSKSGIAFSASTNPHNDDNDDYRIIYEVAFEPAALDKGRIELWLTDSGHLAVGIERFDRIARRLGTRLHRKGFVAGHEPCDVSCNSLRVIFDAVTNGKFVLGVNAALGFVSSTNFYLDKIEYDKIVEIDRQYGSWITPFPSDYNRGFSFTVSHVFRFSHW